jgi:nucleotide-binding universal stress UspA family protein
VPDVSREILTQDRGPIDLFTFGSNTHEVIRAALCPMLTIRGG